MPTWSWLRLRAPQAAARGSTQPSLWAVRACMPCGGAAACDFSSFCSACVNTACTWAPGGERCAPTHQPAWGAACMYSCLPAAQGGGQASLLVSSKQRPARGDGRVLPRRRACCTIACSEFSGARCCRCTCVTHGVIFTRGPAVVAVDGILYCYYQRPRPSGACAAHRMTAVPGMSGCVCTALGLHLVRRMRCVRPQLGQRGLQRLVLGS